MERTLFCAAFWRHGRGGEVDLPMAIKNSFRWEDQVSTSRNKLMMAMDQRNDATKWGYSNLSHSRTRMKIRSRIEKGNECKCRKSDTVPQSSGRSQGTEQVPRGSNGVNCGKMALLIAQVLQPSPPIKLHFGTCCDSRSIGMCPEVI